MKNKMVKRICNRYYHLYEDDSTDSNSTSTDNSKQQSSTSTGANNNSNGNNTQTTTDPQIAALRNKIVTMQQQLQQKEEQLNNFRNITNKQIIMINQQLVKLGAAPAGVPSSESVNTKFRFSKRLYESLVTSKSDELAAAVKTTLDNLDGLSYYMDAKTIKAFARRILAWINDQDWNDGKDHWDDLEDKIRQMLSNGTVSMSRREINLFVEEFAKVLDDNTVFSWIFGNKMNRRR